MSKIHNGKKASLLVRAAASLVAAGLLGWGIGR